MKAWLTQGAVLFAISLAANAQGIYNNASSPKDTVCPLIQRDTTDLNQGAVGSRARRPKESDNPSKGMVFQTTGGLVGATMAGKSFYQQGEQFFPQDQRKDVSLFTAYDAKARGTALASLKGKVVLVGLWSTRCDPSAKMLMEFAGLYPKADQYGFRVLAVNFDLNQQDAGDGGIEGGWLAINKFMVRNRQFFETSKMPVFTPGLGKEGASNFMDIVHSLPVLFVIDRQGRLASLHVGYKDGFVGEALKRALVEKATPAVLPSPVPAQPAN